MSLSLVPQVELIDGNWCVKGVPVAYDENDRVALVSRLREQHKQENGTELRLLTTIRETRTAIARLVAVIAHIESMPDEKVEQVARAIRRVTFGAADSEWDGLNESRKKEYRAQAIEILDAVEL